MLGLMPGGNGFAKNPATDLAAEERGVPDEALIEAVSAGREVFM
jgi:hypothetical protein